MAQSEEELIESKSSYLKRIMLFAQLGSTSPGRQKNSNRKH